jgi:hypothetical protein
MAISSVQAMELSQVLGALLASVVDAQAQSARATVEFVESIGFESTNNGERMRTVKLRYTKKDETDTPAEFEVEVPLLALVNVPSLAVKQATLNFSYDVVTASTTAAPVEGEPKPILPGLKSAILKGFVRRPTATGQDAERRTTSIDLVVMLEQQDMPIGVERLFDLAELGITERPTEAEEPS